MSLQMNHPLLERLRQTKPIVRISYYLDPIGRPSCERILNGVFRPPPSLRTSLPRDLTRDNEKGQRGKSDNHH